MIQHLLCNQEHRAPSTTPNTSPPRTYPPLNRPSQSLYPPTDPPDIPARSSSTSDFPSPPSDIPSSYPPIHTSTHTPDIPARSSTLAELRAITAAPGLKAPDTFCRACRGRGRQRAVSRRAEDTHCCQEGAQATSPSLHTPRLTGSSQ